ncbi:hypothetical protein QUB68_04855 [Microcoleus sp. A006_D1]|uniref:hypothetical protein n=1 Tax=Microcoleus sp. A006_D1 TaxID=3055267 RepID=UPI002FD6E6EC
MARSLEKVQVSLKWYSNCVTRTSPALLCASQPPNITQGLGVGARAASESGLLKLL